MDVIDLPGVKLIHSEIFYLNLLILSVGTGPGMCGADRRKAQVRSDRETLKLSPHLSTKVALNEDNL